VRTGTNHFSLAFTYDCIAWSRDRGEPPLSAAWVPDRPWQSIMDVRF
jgi:hypothetical protein